MPWFLGNAHAIGFMQWGIVPLIIWSQIWKGLALWHAAKRNETWWFIALLVINTVGILELCYLIFVVQLLKGQQTKIKKKRA